MICQCRAVTFSVSFDAATVSGENIAILFRPSDTCYGEEGNGIDEGSGAELELLLGLHRRRIPVIGAIKVWNHFSYALLLCDMHLLLCQRFLAAIYGDTRGPTRNCEGGGWHNTRLARLQPDLRRSESDHAGARHGDLVNTGL